MMYKFFLSILIVISFSKWAMANNDSNDIENSGFKTEKSVQLEPRSNIEIAIDQTVDPEKRIAALNSIHQRSFDRTFKPEVIDHIMTIAMNFTEQDRVRIAAIYSLEYAVLPSDDVQQIRSLVKADDSNWSIRQAANWLINPSMRQPERIRVDMKMIFDKVFNQLFLRDIQRKITAGKLSETQMQALISNIMTEILILIAVDKKMNSSIRRTAFSRIYSDKLSRDFSSEITNKIVQILMDEVELNQIREFALYALAEADLDVNMVEQIRKLSADNSETVEEIRQAALWLTRLTAIRRVMHHNVSQKSNEALEASIEQTKEINKNRNGGRSLTKQQMEWVVERSVTSVFLGLVEDKELDSTTRAAGFMWMYGKHFVEKLTQQEINRIISIAMDSSESNNIRMWALANLAQVELDRSTVQQIKASFLSTESGERIRQIIDLLTRRVEIQIRVNQNKSSEEMFGKSFETSVANWLEGRLSEVYSKKVRSLLNISTDRRRSVQQRLSAFNSIHQMSEGDELDTEVSNRILNVVMEKEESENLKEQALTALEGSELNQGGYSSITRSYWIK